MGHYEQHDLEPRPWEEIQLAYVLWNSRTFTQGMPALIDLHMTAATPANVDTFTPKKSGEFCLRAERALRSGEPVKVDYGAKGKTPLQFFMQYGFAMEADAHKDAATAEDDECMGLRDGELRGYSQGNREHPHKDLAGPLRHMAEHYGRSHCTGDAPWASVQVPAERFASESEQVPCSRQSTDRDDYRFCAWLADKCDYQGVERVFIAKFNHDGNQVRGLGVTKDTSIGENIFCFRTNHGSGLRNRCLDFSGTMHSGSARLPEHLRKLAADTDSPCQAKRYSTEVDTVQVLFLAEELTHGSASFFAPYLALLPSLAELEQHPLRRKKLSSDWKESFRSVRKCWEHYRATVTNAKRPDVSEDTLHRAVILMASRGLHHHGNILLPLVDFINTHVDARLFGARLVEGEDGNICLTARRSIRAGEEILIDYGRKLEAPSAFFMKHGVAWETALPFTPVKF